MGNARLGSVVTSLIVVRHNSNDDIPQSFVTIYQMRGKECYTWLYIYYLWLFKIFYLNKNRHDNKENKTYEQAMGIVEGRGYLWYIPLNKFF